MEQASNKSLFSKENLVGYRESVDNYNKREARRKVVATATKAMAILALYLGVQKWVAALEELIPPDNNNTAHTAPKK